MTASLAEFSAKRRVGRVCWVCDLPERGEIESGFKQGIPVPAIFDWLSEDVGYAEATEDKVRSHFRRKHHEQNA